MENPVRFKVGDIVKDERGFIGRVGGISVDIFYDMVKVDKNFEYDSWSIHDKIGAGKHTLGKNETKIEEARKVK